MKLKLLIAVFSLLSCFYSKAQNLIVNGSFESYTNIDCSSGNISALNNWSSLVSPDYFNSVCSGSYGIPYNIFGNMGALNGSAYLGIVSFNRSTDLKEYIYQHLSAPLFAGKSYYVSFYVSKSKRVTFSIKNIGAYLSVAQPSATPYYVSGSPQVENQSGFLTDTVNWTKVEGYFTAAGGEQYITIGNFNSNASTDTLRVGTYNPFSGDPGTAYYYIDSVSLYDALTLDIEKLPVDKRFNLYPNPGNGMLNLDYKISDQAELSIYDLRGREVDHYALDPSQNVLTLDETRLGAGAYFYNIRSAQALLKQGKLIIVK